MFSIILLNVSFWLFMLSLYFYKHTKNINKRFREEIHLVSQNPFHLKLPVSKSAYHKVLQICHSRYNNTAGFRIQETLTSIIDDAVFLGKLPKG